MAAGAGVNRVNDTWPYLLSRSLQRTVYPGERIGGITAR